VTRLALIGVSVRALAESAALAGEEVVAADFFGDRDLARVCESYAVGRDLGLPLTAQGLATAARRLRADAVVYAANLENHPEVVAGISGWARVIGNDAATLARVRDWASLRRVCAAAGIAVPETLLPGEERRARAGVRWLRKRRRSGGGHGVRRWCGTALDADHLLQAEIPGRPASVAFVADGQGARVLAVSEQLIGRRRLGARGFTWCGNLVPFTTAPAEADALLPQARRAATVLTRHYGLRGLNGLDCVVERDVHGALRLWLIEVNPRFTASMELAEAAVGRSLFALHVAACEGRLPADLLETAPQGHAAKGVVYARRMCTMPATTDWRLRGRSDVPWPGQRIEKGHPVCSVRCAGASRAACLTGLRRAAAAVYEEIEAPVAGVQPGPAPETGARVLARTETPAQGPPGPYVEEVL